MFMIASERAHVVLVVFVSVRVAFELLRVAARACKAFHLDVGHLRPPLLSGADKHARWRRVPLASATPRS